MTTARKTPWLLIALMALIAAAASSAGMYLFMTHQADALAGSPGSHEQDGRHEAPLLVTIAPMTVNLLGERNDPSLLYVGIVLEVGNEQTQYFVQQHMPQVRSRILTLLSGQNSAQLIGADGKTALSARILETLRQALGTQQPPLAILNVLYTDFIVQ